MNIKASYWYQMLDHKKAILIYYLVLACISTVSSLFSYTTDPSGSSSLMIGGMELVTLIFLFVVGLCSFKENFGMLLQNSVSRKTVFIGRLLTSISIAGIMALSDRVFITLCNLLFSGNKSVFIDTIFSQIYVSMHPEMNGLFILFGSFLFAFTLYLSALAIGYMITLLFFRLGKAGKISVSVGVPLIFTFLLPMLESFWFHGKIGMAINAFFDTAYGIGDGKFQNAVFTGLILFLAISLINWLLMKKAIVRK